MLKKEDTRKYSLKGERERLQSWSNFLNAFEIGTICAYQLTMLTLAYAKSPLCYFGNLSLA